MSENGARPHTHAPWDTAAALAVVEPLKDLPGATLPVLHALQHEFGYIHADAIPLVADVLNLSKAEIVGVVNFYHDFLQAPPPAHTIQVCRAEACQAMGCEALVVELEAAFGSEVSIESTARNVALKPVYCLGNCALSPAAMVDGLLVGRATVSRLLAMVSGAAT
jgi:formate dehydrogenase subunit gamma